MEFCKYHPLQAALNVCPQCQVHTCKACVDEGKYGDEARCLMCDGATDSLGVVGDIEPFWRRIDKSFRYPLVTPLLVFLGVVSLLSAVSIFLPMPLMVGLNILITGVTIKYCFNCLSETAMGKMQAPPVSSAYEGGVVLIFRLLIMMIVACVAVGVVYVKVNHALGSVLGFFLIIALPAIVIVYAMTQSMVQSLNPIKLLSLIATIGMPYGLILAILMIMIGSVQLLSEVIGLDNSVITLTLQAGVSNFYSVVMFHLMGYMIYQYQHRLGYDLAEEHRDYTEIRPEQDRVLARIGIMVKEGYWGTAQQLFEQGLKRFRGDKTLNEQYFQFMLTTLPGSIAQYERKALHAGTSKTATDPSEHITTVIDGYLAFLIRSDQKHALCFAHKQALIAWPAYRPAQPEICFELAKNYYSSGDPKACVKLINGLHKRFPNFHFLIPAYEQMLIALRDIPNMQAQTLQCQKLVAVLRHRAKLKAQEKSEQKVSQAASKSAAGQSPAAKSEAAKPAAAVEPSEKPSTKASFTLPEVAVPQLKKPRVKKPAAPATDDKTPRETRTSERTGSDADSLVLDDTDNNTPPETLAPIEFK